MRMLHDYDIDAIQRIVDIEEWASPLPPVRKLKQLSARHQVAFWALRIYVAAMLVVVAYAFAMGIR